MQKAGVRLSAFMQSLTALTMSTPVGRCLMQSAGMTSLAPAHTSARITELKLLSTPLTHFPGHVSVAPAHNVTRSLGENPKGGVMAQSTCGWVGVRLGPHTM